jgi:hypothetical protein
MPGTTLLFDAIERYYALMVSEDPAGRRTFAELHQWFESRDAGPADSFERLCDRHGLDPHAIRRLLRQRRAAADRS